MPGKYASTGTIRVQVQSSQTEPAAAGMTIFFVPDCHHVVQHGSKSWAVFVPCNGSTGAMLRDLKKGCCIAVKCEPSKLRFAVISAAAISAAAANQCKVEINVECDDQQLTLTEITFPAKRDK